MEAQANGNGHIVEDLIRAGEARVNVTWKGQNGDLPDPVPFDASDTDVRRWVTEAVRAGIPGITADPEANFDDFVVDRFPAPADPQPGQRAHALHSVRPKTPFGVQSHRGCGATREEELRALKRAGLTNMSEELELREIERQRVIREVNRVQDARRGNKG